MSHSRSSQQKVRRKPLTKSMLLPLPASMVRVTSLQNHLALEALRSGHGQSLHVTFLYRALYLTYLLRDTVRECCCIKVFREADAALIQCSVRAENEDKWLLLDTEIGALQTVLTVHDRQLKSLPRHVYTSACERVLRHATNNASPLISTEHTDERPPAL